MMKIRAILLAGCLISLLLTVPAFSDTSGGGALDLGSARVWMAEISFADTVAAAKVDLPVAWGEPYAYLSTDGFPAVSIVLTDYVHYGDGSTIAGDGIFIGTGLDDPLFVNLGNLTTTWQVEIVVVAAGTMKSRITAAHSPVDISKYGNYGDYSTTIAIPTTVYANGAGLGIDFNAAGGHTIGDRWLITNYADDGYLGAKAGQISTTRADLDAAVVCPVMFFWESSELTY